MTMLPSNVNPETEDFDWTQLLDEYDYARPQRGEVRDGVVMKIEDDSILVSIGTKREGIIPQQDLRQMGDEFVDGLKVGDTIQVYVQDPENREGELVLSLTMVQVARDWEDAARLSAEGGIVQGQVIGYNKGGLLVQFNRIRGFVPASQVAQLHGRTASEERQQAQGGLAVSRSGRLEGDLGPGVVVAAFLVGDDGGQAVHAAALEEADQHVAPRRCTGLAEGQAGHPARQGRAGGQGAAAQQFAAGHSLLDHDGPPSASGSWGCRRAGRPRAAGGRAAGSPRARPRRRG